MERGSYGRIDVSAPVWGADVTVVDVPATGPARAARDRSPRRMGMDHTKTHGIRGSPTADRRSLTANR